MERLEFDLAVPLFRCSAGSLASASTTRRGITQFFPRTAACWKATSQPSCFLRERFDGALDDGFLKLKEWKNAERLLIRRRILN
jgi:hypothetical protein